MSILITRKTNDMSASMTASSSNSNTDSITDVCADDLLSPSDNHLISTIEDDSPVWLMVLIALFSFVICYWIIFHFNTVARIFSSIKIPQRPTKSPYPYDDPTADPTADPAVDPDENP